MDDCKVYWKEFSKDSKTYANNMFCSLHNKVFNKTDNCPLYISKNTLLPSVSHANARMFRVGMGFEQGIEQGVTSVTRRSDKHSHAFRFVVLLPSDLKDWGSRQDVLRSKGFRADRKGGIGRIFMSDCFGFKCWFADKSITIYFPSWKRYFVDEARFGYNLALDDLRVLLNRLEDVFGVSFVQDGKYVFKVAGQHHGLVHNSLAKMYNRNKEKLQVYDKDNEFWLLIDNSHPEGFGLNECETINPKSAVPDMDDVVAPFFNDLRDNNPDLPSVQSGKINAIQDDLKGLSGTLRHLDESIGWLDKNIAGHKVVLGKIGDSFDKFSNKLDNAHLGGGVVESHSFPLHSSEVVGRDDFLNPRSFDSSLLTISKFDDAATVKRKRLCYYKGVFGW